MASSFSLTGEDRVPVTHDFALEIFWKDGEVARDLTGWLLFFVINLPGPTDYTRSIGSGITVPTPANGKAYLRITAAQLVALPRGTHTYHCIATKDGNTEALIETSQIEIE